LGGRPPSAALTWTVVADPTGGIWFVVVTTGIPPTVFNWIMTPTV
jgi:hypothetical protein